MIKVSCPSCNAAYDVDEHRLPADGLRMRCPKCSERFNVHRDGSTAKSGTGSSASGAAKPPPRKPTQVGLGPTAPPPPSAAARRSADLPAHAGDIDLPAPFSRGELEDLPTPKGGPSLDFDPFGDPGVADLPAPKSDPAASGFDPFADMDLPAPVEAPSGVDLPAPLSRSLKEETDLPVPMRGDRMRPTEVTNDEVDLPMALSDAELPTPRLSSVVPAPISLDSELPMSAKDKDLPVVREDFADLDFDGPERVHGGGPIELDLPDGDDLDLAMELDAPVGAPAPPPPLGAGFEAPAAPASGDLPSERRISGDSDELELPESDELEFSELPGAGDGDVERMPRPAGTGADVVAASKRRIKAISIQRPEWLMKAVAVFGALAVILGAGFYLGTTEYGLFGVHLVEPFLPASGDDLLIAQTIEEAEIIAASDTYSATRQALALLDAARRDAELNRALVARSLLHQSFFQVRYGQDAQSADLADQLRLHLQRRGDKAPRVHVALAADALRNADTTNAASELALAVKEEPTDVYVDLVAGELALRKRDGQAALDAFDRALRKHDSARAQWGRARGYRLLGDDDKAVAAARETLKLSPSHVAARVSVAGLLIAEGKLDDAYDLLSAPAGLTPIEGRTLQVAKADKSAALTLIGRIEDSRGRLGAARELYEKAIELDTSNLEAALGAARLVMLERSYPDAYARFQTVLGSDVPPGARMDPTGKPKVVVDAKIGAAEALLAMDKAEEAKKLLSDLQTPEPVNATVELWHGKVAEALEDSEKAVTRFRNAISLEPKSYRAYMALAQHYTATKRPGEAVDVLLEAKKNVEITAEVRRMLGWAELQRNRIDEAMAEFIAALQMEPRDSSAQFGLAVAYRRKGMIAEAGAQLAKVRELDAKFPGLALEQGRLAEAAGEMNAAVASYREALLETPKDSALRSRLGAVLVLTGKTDEGEKLLREVLETQQYSAEAEHYLGRIDLSRGQIEDARQHFLRAARLESDNGLYRMYVAWVALESNQMTTALRELETALKLDPTLGDAYWLRARIRIRAGVVRDALDDLTKAVELNPKRIDAWAAMGECHYQLGQTREAIKDFEKAVAGDPQRGYWWYRLGRLQLDEGMRSEALTSLSTATSLGSQDSDDEAWLADAYRLTGDIHYAQKRRQEAIDQYGRYLELAGRDDIDRRDVEAKLRRIGEGLD